MKATGEQRTAVVLAGGGERVIAWQVGVLAGLADSGVDLRDAGTIIGTSSGAYVAARLAAGEDPRLAAHHIAAQDPAQQGAGAALHGTALERAAMRPASAGPDHPVPQPDGAPFERMAEAFASAGTTLEGRRRIGAVALAARTRSERAWVAAVADRLPAAEGPAALHLVAVDAERGERVTIDASSGVSLPVGVAASRAVPVALPPISVAGRRLIHGAIGSATNADLALRADPELERVLVIAALPAGPAYAKLTQLWDEALKSELWQLDAAGVDTYIVRASTADLELMGPNMMSGGAAPMAVRAGQRAGQAVGPALRMVMQAADERSYYAA